MRRLIPVAVLVVVFGLSVVASAFAADDNDIPGNPLTLGVSVSATVDSTDPVDVYSVNLIAGQEVEVRLDPGNFTGNAGRIHVLVPGASSISESGLYDEIQYDAVGGTPKVDKHGVYFRYIPPKSGTYYLGVEWTQGTLSYSLCVTRTSRAPLTLAADADSIPGTPIGSAVVTGVVSTIADPVDVYQVALAAGQRATIQLAPLTPYANYFAAKARLSLLDSPSISAGDGDVIAGPLEAVAASTDSECRTATILYAPVRSGTYYVLVEAGPFAEPKYGMNFAYKLTVSGAGSSSGGAGGDGAGAGQFVDVAGSPYAAAIYELAGRGIITGFEDGTFRPNASVTRQQFAKMIVKTLALDVTGNENCPFTDVAAQTGSDPLYPSKYVAVCALNGITMGKTATTFDPSSTITHEQLITMVTRAADPGDPPASYTTLFTADRFSLPDHYANARRAAYAGLLDGLQGIGSGYKFGGPSTRGECAQMLHNLLRLD
jgi:hypothetical protein